MKKSKDSNLLEWMNSARSLDTSSLYKNTQKQKMHISMYQEQTNKKFKKDTTTAPKTIKDPKTNLIKNKKDSENYKIY